MIVGDLNGNPSGDILLKRNREMNGEGIRRQVKKFWSEGFFRASGSVQHGQKWIVAKVAEALGTTPRSLEHLKKRFVKEGLPAAIERKKRVKPPREIQFGGEFEAHLLALACSDAPAGNKRWTVRLLAEKMIELKIVPTVSPMTVCNTLKKMNLSLT